MARIFAVLVVLVLFGCATPPPAGQQFIVFFSADNTVLTPEGRQVVDEIVATVKRAQPSQVTVEGHDDGGTAHDAEVAQQRGQHIVAALVAAGIEPKLVLQLPGAPPESATGIAAHKVVVRLINKA